MKAVATVVMNRVHVFLMANIKEYAGGFTPLSCNLISSHVLKKQLLEYNAQNILI